MALSIEYVARETGNNLRRNVLMTTGAILCVAVSLTIVGIALVLKQGVSRATIQWRNGVDMSIFMRADAPPQQTEAIRTQLQAEKGTDIKSFTYCDQACAYKEFKTMFANSTDFLQSVGQSDLPPSFRVVPTHPQLIEQIGDRYQNQPGVQSVEYAKDAIKGLLTVTHYAQVAFLTLAAILLVLAILLIVNTIRMAIFIIGADVGTAGSAAAVSRFLDV